MKVLFGILVVTVLGLLVAAAALARRLRRQMKAAKAQPGDTTKMLEREHDTIIAKQP